MYFNKLSYKNHKIMFTIFCDRTNIFKLGYKICVYFRKIELKKYKLYL
jgi:hypothetical protein